MTILEAGIIAGAFSGAFLGTFVGGHHGLWGALGGIAVGIFAGGVAGWLFAMLLIGLLSLVGVLWRAARKQARDPLTESEISTMTPVAVAGTFLSAWVGLMVLKAVDWRVALLSIFASACLTALAAVARCELGRGG